MLSKKNFLSPTKPLYGSEFSQKNVEPLDLTTVKDFLRFYTAKGKGKIIE